MARRRALVEIIVKLRDEASRGLKQITTQTQAMRQSVALNTAQMQYFSDAWSVASTTGGVFTATVQDVTVAQRQAAAEAAKLAARTRTLNLIWLSVGAAASTAAVAMTLTAARTEELGVVVQAMGRSHDYAAGQIQATEDRIKALGITTQTARLLITQLIGSQIGLAHATDVARAAQNLAVLGMTDSSEAAADLAYSIASLQPRLLRKYRIYVSLVDVYRKAATELGKNVTQLTEMEKQQAFLNAILEEAAEYSGLYEAAMTTAGKQMRSLRREAQETANEFGEHLLPMMGGVVGMTSDLLEILRDLPDPLQAATIHVMALAGVTAVLQKGAALLGITVSGPVIATMVALAGTIVTVYGETKQMRAELEEAEKQALATADSFDEYTVALLRAVSATGIAARADVIFSHGHIAVTEGLGKSSKQWDILKRSMEYTTTAAFKQQSALYSLDKSWRDIIATQEDAISSVEKIYATYGDAIVTMATFFGDASRAAENYAGDLLTIQRRRQYLEARMEEEGWSESLDRQLTANIKQEAALETRNERMLAQNKRLMGQMLMTAAQAAGLGLDFVLELGKAYEIFTEEQVAQAGLAVSTIEAIKAGALTEEAGIAMLRGMPGALPGIAMPTIPEVAVPEVPVPAVAIAEASLAPLVAEVESTWLPMIYKADEVMEDVWLPMIHKADEAIETTFLPMIYKASESIEAAFLPTIESLDAMPAAVDTATMGLMAFGAGAQMMIEQIYLPMIMKGTSEAPQPYLPMIMKGIPSMADGGIIPGPAGQPRLIVAHGGETVAPAGGGGLTITIGALYGTDRKAALLFSREVARELRMQGVITR